MFSNHVQYHFNFSRINKIPRERLKYKYGQGREYFSKITKGWDDYSVLKNKIFERKTFCRTGVKARIFTKKFELSGKSYLPINPFMSNNLIRNIFQITFFYESVPFIKFSCCQVFLSLVKFCLFNKKAIKKINCEINNKPTLDHICTIRIYRAFQEFTFAISKNIFTLKFVFAYLTKRYFVKIHENLHFSAKVMKFIRVKSSDNETLKLETVSSNACNCNNQQY